MAIPQNQVPATAQEAVLNLAKALGVEIEIKGSQEQIEAQEPKKKHKGRKLPKVLNAQQVDKLFAPINIECNTGLRNRTICETMLCAGLRVSEICNLAPGSVDFTEDMIHIIDGKGGVDRNVPIRPSLREWLEKWDEIRPRDSEFFFCAVNKGTQLLPRYLNQVLERLSNKSGVFLQDGQKQVPVSCHKLRHTCATNWLREGFSLPEIQRLLGHSNIQTTLIYLEVSMEDIKNKMMKLE
jgi:site-specific recombinase XerD